MEPKNKLSKVILGPDWIDLSYGDTPVVAKALQDTLKQSFWDFKSVASVDLTECAYQPSNGYPPLVEFLEKKYGTKVVITNGAKQGMAAAMHALKFDGAKKLYAMSPYWPSLTALFEDLNLKCTYDKYEKVDGAVVTFPNNPDGSFEENLIGWFACVPTIHDAAYYTEVYTFDSTELSPRGDMQVFTYSKMYGVGGLRVGYVVCHNPDYASKVAEFVERSTSSVSVASQKMVYTIDKYMNENPRAKWSFVFEAQRQLREAREEFAKIDGDVLIIEDMVEFINSKSMFAWVKIGPKLDLKKAKVHALEGSIFGQPGMMRFNLAVGPNKIREAIKRLNKFKKKKKR